MQFVKSALVLPALMGLCASQAYAQQPGHLVINPTFDSSITNDPNAQTIESTIRSAIGVYEQTFSNPITVNITFASVTDGLGSSSHDYQTVSYSDYVAALRRNEQGQGFLQYVPDANPVNGSTELQVDPSNLRALGFSGYDRTSDGTISLNTSDMNLSRSGPQDPNKYDLVATAEHEIDEELGLNSRLDDFSFGTFDPNAPIGNLDLFRYGAPGQRSYTTDANATAYLSADGGKTAIVYFNQTKGGDFHDFYSDGSNPNAVQTMPRVQDAFGSPGTQEDLGPAEIMALQMSGYTLAAAPEPSQFAALGLGLLGLGGLALRARRRAARA